MAESSLRDSFFQRHSRTINAFTSILLICLCAISYILLILLFTAPGIFGLPSLVQHEDSRISPTVGIPLLVAVLSGATSALVTRAVEQNLWIKILSGQKQVSGKETHRLAQWSISALGRLFYTINGESWILRFSALLLFGCTILSPILLYGVTPAQSSTVSTKQVGITDEAYLAFENSLLPSDAPTTLAASLAINNLSPPQSELCRSPSCNVTAQSFSFQASCQASQRDNPQGAGSFYTDKYAQVTICSRYSPHICASLTTIPLDLSHDGNNTFANFTTSRPDCDFLRKLGLYTDPPGLGPGGVYGDLICGIEGEFSTIFGIWVNIGSSWSDPATIQVIDCRVQNGDILITQAAGSPPTLQRASFVKHELYTPRDSLLSSPLKNLQMQVGSSGVTYTPTFSFSGTWSVDGLSGLPAFANDLLNISWNRPYANASLVARKIEASFDMLTLLSFARYPGLANATITTTAEQIVWRYDARVLAILAVPLLTTVLVLSTNWKIGGDNEIIGYDPVRTAQRADEVLLSVSDDDKTVNRYDLKDVVHEEEDSRKETASSIHSSLLEGNAVSEQTSRIQGTGARTW